MSRFTWSTRTGGEALLLAVPDLGRPSVLVDVPLPIDHPTLSARLVWNDGTGERRGADDTQRLSRPE